MKFISLFKDTLMSDIIQSIKNSTEISNIEKKVLIQNIEMERLIFRIRTGPEDIKRHIYSFLCTPELFCDFFKIKLDFYKKHVYYFENQTKDKIKEYFEYYHDVIKHTTITRNFIRLNFIMLYLGMEHEYKGKQYVSKRIYSVIKHFEENNAM